MSCGMPLVSCFYSFCLTFYPSTTTFLQRAFPTFPLPFLLPRTALPHCASSPRCLPGLPHLLCMCGMSSVHVFPCLACFRPAYLRESNGGRTSPPGTLTLYARCPAFCPPPDWFSPVAARPSPFTYLLPTYLEAVSGESERTLIPSFLPVFLLSCFFLSPPTYLMAYMSSPPLLPCN